MAANPYGQGWREWDERYADLVIGKRNWQIATFGLLLATIILAAGMIWLSARSRYVPYVVVTDRLGQAMTIPATLTPASMPVVAARMEHWEVGAFIRDARSVSSDAAVEQERLASLHGHARGAPIGFWTSITIPTTSPITRSRLRRSRRSRCGSIRSWSFQRRVIRCVGRKRRATSTE